MKKKFKSNFKKDNKNTPSSYLVSLGFHLIIFLIAGVIIVFKIEDKEYKKFVPPKPVERQKVQLKKPQINLNNNTQSKPISRIVTKAKSSKISEVSLPAFNGIGDGFFSNNGSFQLKPIEQKITLFGGGESIGNDFIGSFYDLKRDKSGRPIPTDPDEMITELQRFVRGGWNTSRLAKFYKSPKKLYATSFMIPPVKSSVAPSAFDEPDTGGWCWAVHYKGKLVHHKDIKFRFWGQGDDVLVVAVDGKTVLNGCWPSSDSEWGIYSIGGSWKSSAKNDFRFFLGNNLARGGDWIELKAGIPKEMDVLIGEVPGGGFCSMLTVEVDGESYDLNRQGGPILPMFKTEEPTLDMIDEIYRVLVPDEASVTNGPVFRDYEFVVANEEIDQIKEVKKINKFREWTLIDGKLFKATFVSKSGDTVFFENEKGKQAKVNFSELIDSDQDFITLLKPPKFDIDFVKSTSVRFIKTTPYLEEEAPRINDFVFTVKIKKNDTKEFDQEIFVEFFAIAKELIGDKYILVDRQKSSFIPSKENEFSHTFSGPPIEFMEYVYDGDRRGKEYAGNLVILYDKFGRVIDFQTSNKWLYENLDDLKKIPIGRFFDKNCKRVIPTSPKAQRY